MWGIYGLYDRYIRPAVDRRDHRRDLHAALAAMSTVEQQQLTSDVLRIVHPADRPCKGKQCNGAGLYIKFVTK